jgi:co-chaperonin GroES (HSP10)
MQTIPCKSTEFVALGENILVSTEIISGEQKSAGGLILGIEKANCINRPMCGKVISVGADNKNVKIGDTVLFPKTDGIDIKFNDCKDEVLDFNTGFILLYSKSILGKISK